MRIGTGGPILGNIKNAKFILDTPSEPCLRSYASEFYKQQRNELGSKLWPKQIKFDKIIIHFIWNNKISNDIWNHQTLLGSRMITLHGIPHALRRGCMLHVIIFTYIRTLFSYLELILLLGKFITSFFWSVFRLANICTPDRYIHFIHQVCFALLFSRARDVTCDVTRTRKQEREREVGWIYLTWFYYVLLLYIATYLFIVTKQWRNYVNKTKQYPLNVMNIGKV